MQNQISQLGSLREKLLEIMAGLGQCVGLIDLAGQQVSQQESNQVQIQEQKLYSCSCGKTYVRSSSLSSHRKRTGHEKVKTEKAVRVRKERTSIPCRYGCGHKPFKFYSDRGKHERKEHGKLFTED